MNKRPGRSRTVQFALPVPTTDVVYNGRMRIGFKTPRSHPRADRPRILRALCASDPTMIGWRRSTNTRTKRANEPTAPRPVVAALERRSLWIDVPDETAGLDLIERLSPLHAELAPASGDESSRVAVELREHLTDEVVSRVLDVVPAWTSANRIEAARVELDGNVYVVRS